MVQEQQLSVTASQSPGNPRCACVKGAASNLNTYIYGSRRCIISVYGYYAPARSLSAPSAFQYRRACARSNSAARAKCACVNLILPERQSPRIFLRVDARLRCPKDEVKSQSVRLSPALCCHFHAFCWSNLRRRRLVFAPKKSTTGGTKYTPGIIIA